MSGCERRAWMRLGLAALAGGVLCGLPASAVAADVVRINATLMRASNDAGAKGGKKQGLPGVLNFNSNQTVGSGSATIAVPGSASISLGQGHSLAVSLSPLSGNRVQASINWRGPAGSMQNTTVRLTRGGPSVFLGGGPKQDGGTMIVSVSAR